jgi:hypothetical protein
MPDDWRCFDSYQIHYLSQHPDFAVEIDCNEKQQLVGRLRFLEAGQALLPNGPAADGVLYVYYELDRFADVLRILREEKPLLMYVDVDTGVGAVSTAHEPAARTKGPSWSTPGRRPRPAGRRRGRA